MTTPPELFTLLLWLFGFLAVATLIGEGLARRISPDGTHPTIENLNARIRSWWNMVILIGLALLAGRTGIVILAAICSFAALREFLTLTTKNRGDHWALVVAFFVVLPVQYVLIWLEWYGLYSIFIPVYGFLFLPIIAAFRGHSENFLHRISETQWALMVCVFCLSHLPALISLEIEGYEGRQIMLVAFLIVVVQMSDVLQYVWGKLLGRHKIAPSLSPSKTWEGFVGGILSSSLIGASLAWMTPFSAFEAAALSLVITMMGFCGGLVMSAIKRDRGVKDWGHLIEGHGGFLDRLDSVIFAAPIFYHLVRFFY